MDAAFLKQKIMVKQNHVILVHSKVRFGETPRQGKEERILCGKLEDLLRVMYEKSNRISGILLTLLESKRCYILRNMKSINYKIVVATIIYFVVALPFWPKCYFSLFWRTCLAAFSQIEDSYFGLRTAH